MNRMMEFCIPRLQGSVGLPALRPGEQSPATGQAGGSGAATTANAGGKIKNILLVSSWEGKVEGWLVGSGFAG